jgi:hypothetical protein
MKVTSAMKRVALSLALTLTATNVFGCSVCVTKPLKFAFQDSQAFFVGRVIDRQQWTVTFQVEEQFKGNVADEITLQMSNSCSFSSFAVGQTYLVEATNDDQGLYAYFCSHTSILGTDDRELRTVRRRAAWWSARFSRISWYRFRELIGRHLGD